jgi:hypothetical protein
VTTPDQADPFFRSQRREAISRDPARIGIDYIQVVPTPAPAQWQLQLYFIPASPPAPATKVVIPQLRPDQVVITGVERLISTNIQVVEIALDQDSALATITIDYGRQVVRDVPLYRLTLIDVPNLDPFFDQVVFSLSRESLGEFGPQPTSASVPAPVPAPQIDYLSKDYASFRQLMLNRLALLIPQWTETNPADIGVTLVEAMAYVADQLSYYQDAVATEAYLGTARQRISIRRHARLLDYMLQEGCNARVWIYFNVAEAVTLEAGTVLLTDAGLATATPVRLAGREGPSPLLDQAGFARAVAQGAKVFQTMYTVDLAPQCNELQFYTWGARDFYLPKGTTRATLIYDPASPPRLGRGDILIFEEVRGLPPNKAPDPTHRHVVRLTDIEPGTDPLGGQFAGGDPSEGIPILTIRWAAEDALPFPLSIAARVGDVNITRISVARGNIVLADHGYEIRGESLPPVPNTGRYEPALEQKDLTFRAPYDHAAMLGRAAALATAQDPRAALPALALWANGQEWTARHDLLSSTWSSRDFVAEMQNDRVAYVRFGDGVLGHRPTPGMQFIATYRSGNGVAGNVGSETLTRLYLPTPADTAGVIPLDKIYSLYNPLPAQGGTEPETIEHARLSAPQAFHSQERCVTEGDYAAIAERHPEVNQARATRRWTGSWYTTFLAVDRANNKPVDSAFQAALAAFMQPYLLTSTELAIMPPDFVPLDIALIVYIAAGHFPNTIRQMLLEVFSDADLQNGQRGFFHPDNFTFGQPVYLSQIVARAKQVPGVVWLEVERFRRWSEVSRGEAEHGYISIGPAEIARVDNNPDAPEYGRISFTVKENIVR